VVEHLNDVERFITSSHRILKTAGYMIHLFPSKFALFAIINQILPRKLSKKILFYVHTQSKGICGFPAFYDRCYYSGILKLLKQHNFEPVDIRISYYQAPYFSFLAPLFLLVGLYEMVIYLLRWKNLGAYVLMVAQKQEQ
jgi:2-polyprenyl-6-hydroxyphenyl methylase/3-demethylubiquinone-9 3-methyltransferase